MKPNKHLNMPGRRRFMQGGAAALALVALSGCSRALSEVTGWGAPVTRHEDLAFGPHPRHRLDLYLPENATPQTPLVQFLYGGSWKWGSRARYGFVGYALASRGLAVAISDYRLHPSVRFPDFNYDAARTAAWLQARRGDYGLAPGPMHLMGHSAGAHIAALLALDPRYLAAFGEERHSLGRLVGLAGPYGMYPSRINFIADIFPPAEREDEARPVTFARADAPPMLLLHGADDGLVDPENSRALAAAQAARGAQAEARFYDGVGHKELVMALAGPLQGVAPVIDDTVTFLTAT